MNEQDGGERRIGHDRLVRSVAQLEANQNNLKEAVGELRTDMKAVLAALSQAKGGWKALIAVGGIAGVAGAAVWKLLLFWPIK